jgi:ribonuclease HII
MREAISQLAPQPDALLIDALSLPALELPQRSLRKADLKCLSVAAASILAKVTRDRAMIGFEVTHPGYGFAQHKGYGTPQHRLALEQHGPTELHRWYYGPVAEAACRRGLPAPRPTYRRETSDV